MSNLVIVAIPEENDRVWKISSEKKPHLTLLFLGEADKVKNLQSIVQFVEHAVNTSLRRFYLPVDRRGELGEDQADVLFFKKDRYDYKAVRDFRMQLLKDNNIKTAYDSTTQREGPWIPHLTLGYPATPAKEPENGDDYGFYGVGFEKIEVWTEDYDGPEFLLKDPWDEWEQMETDPMSIAMSDLQGANPEDLQRYRAKVDHKLAPDAEDEDELEQSIEEGAEFLVHTGLMTAEEFLEEYGIVHYGVRGMHWGVRRGRAAPVAVNTTGTSRVPHGNKRKTKIKVEGGENHPAHEDAIGVAESRAKLKKSGMAALSNSELQKMQKRLNLEVQVAQLTSSKGRQFVMNQLEQEGRQQVQTGVRKGVKVGGKKVIKKAGKAAATTAVTVALL